MIRRCGFPEMIRAMLASGFRKPVSVTMHPDDYADVMAKHNEADGSPARVVNEFEGIKLYVSMRKQPGEWSFEYEGDDGQEE